MKKIIFSLIALMACMSINAQVVKVYDTKSSTTEPEATYTNSSSHKYKVVFEEVTNHYNNDYEYVDLGLPSGTLWATRNVGANHPEDFGLYFQWGWRNGYSAGDSYDFNDTNYQDEDGVANPMEYGDLYGKYNLDDGLTTLESDEDAAAFNWEGTWRMPTQEDWDELRENCTFYHTSLNGVKGCYAIGHNGNSIFLPAAGYMDNNDLQSENTEGCYWTSSLTKNNVKYAYVLWFDSGDDDDTRPQADGSDLRYRGLSIRPVFTKTTPTFEFPIAGKTLYVAEDYTLAVETNSDSEITYSSSDESVASVDAYGTVYTHKLGKVTITATAASTDTYKAATASYTVTVIRATPSCVFSILSTAVSVGKTFTQVLETNSDATVTYSSSDTSIATVDANGKVTIVGTGQATITGSVAQTDKFKAGSGFYYVTGIQTNTTCSFSVLTATLEVGHTYTQTPTTNSSGAITYTSSNDAVATVDANGKVTALARGQVTITATVAASGNYKAAYDYYYITVTDPNLLTGKFSVSSTKKVLFTSGNLYWNGEKLRCWAAQTSGMSKWNANCVSHFYWTKSAQDSYQDGNDVDESKFSDECEPFFAESQGGLTVEGDRTGRSTSGLYVLTCDEWYYLLFYRPNASNLRLDGVTVTNVGNSYDNCCILAPDDYSGPALTTITDWSESNANSLGLVILPAGGFRGDETIEGIFGDWVWHPNRIEEYNNYKWYWTSSPYSKSTYRALGVGFDNTTINYGGERKSGRSVRLVANP